MFHELYHINPAFNGDIRRMGKFKTAHGHSKKSFEEKYIEYADTFFKTIQNTSYIQFLQMTSEDIRNSFKIVKYRLPLQKKKFGIKEPNNSFVRPNKIDLAIVPVVGIDGLGKRIGYGKGMYDRFFDRLTYRPTILFTQLTLCRTEQILSDNYDIQADYIITN